MGVVVGTTILPTVGLLADERKLAEAQIEYALCTISVEQFNFRSERGAAFIERFKDTVEPELHYQYPRAASWALLREKVAYRETNTAKPKFVRISVKELDATLARLHGLPRVCTFEGETTPRIVRDAMYGGRVLDATALLKTRGKTTHTNIAIEYPSYVREEDRATVRARWNEPVSDSSDEDVKAEDSALGALNIDLGDALPEVAMEDDAPAAGPSMATRSSTCLLRSSAAAPPPAPIVVDSPSPPRKRRRPLDPAAPAFFVGSSRASSTSGRSPAGSSRAPALAPSLSEDTTFSFNRFDDVFSAAASPALVANPLRRYPAPERITDAAAARGIVRGRWATVVGLSRQLIQATTDIRTFAAREEELTGVAYGGPLREVLPFARAATANEDVDVPRIAKKIREFLEAEILGHTDVPMAE